MRHQEPLSGVLEVNNLRREGLASSSFVLRKGECIAVRGPSGAGKTLLLRAIADLDVNEGDVQLNGCSRESMSAPAWRRRVGYVPAEPGWWADTIGSHFRDWTATLPLIRRLGLPDDACDWRIVRPSTGERQRLALARALLEEPDVLLLDEPTSALDQATTLDVESLLREHVRAGLAILWVSHDDAQARRIATRVLIVERGIVREQESA